MAKKSVSIIIPNLNGQDFLLDCLNSVYRSQFDGPLEVILVDNASTDHSADKAKKAFPQIKLIRLSKNHGFAKAVNLGLKRAKGQYLFLLNNDIVLETKTISHLVKSLEKNPLLGLVGGKIYQASTKTYLGGANLEPYLGFMIHDSQNSKSREVDWLSGSSLMIKKEVVDLVGLLDEKYFFYFEDTDYCLRARRAGFKLFFNSQAKLTHRGGLSTKEKSQQWVNQNWYRGKFRCLLKYGTLGQILTSLAGQLMMLPIKAVIKNEGSGKAQLSALFWAWKNHDR